MTVPVSTDIATAREANINAWADAIGAGNADEWRKCFSPGATIREDAFGDQTVEAGELRDYAATVFESIKIDRPTFQTIIHDDERTAVWWRMTGTAAKPWPGVFDTITPGAKFTFDGVSIFEFDENYRYASQNVFWDLRSLARQVSPEANALELMQELRHLHLKHLDTSGRFVEDARGSFAKIDELHSQLLVRETAG